jgi:hypothetical protein
MGDEQRFWRVYRFEWAVVFISDSAGENGIRECQQRFDAEYDGKVRVWRLGPWSLTEPDSWPWALELMLPVMKGEYTSRPPALEHAHKIDGAAVLEGSKEDKKLLNYGKRMLREVKSNAGGGDGAG